LGKTKGEESKGGSSKEVRGKEKEKRAEKRKDNRS